MEWGRDITMIAAALLTGCGVENAASGDAGSAVGARMTGDRAAVEEVVLETASLDELQVQPPEPIDYKPARSGDIRILPESLICFATHTSRELRQRLNLPDDVSFGAGIAGGFDRVLNAADMPRALDGTTRLTGVIQASAEKRRRSYQQSCYWTRENIYVNVAIGANDEGQPYRIVATMRQGGAEWQRMVERTPEQIHECVFPSPQATTIERQLELTITCDMNDFGKIFERFLQVGSEV